VAWSQFASSEFVFCGNLRLGTPNCAFTEDHVVRSNHGAAHGEDREDDVRLPTPLAQLPRKSNKSASWWREQARAGRFRTVPFGASEAIPPDEMDRIAREGLPPLPRRAPKGKTAA
jgi:hypothetical protein